MLVYFTYGVNHGNSKEGDKVIMQKSTAKALEAHEIGKVGGKVPTKKKK